MRFTLLYTDNKQFMDPFYPQRPLDGHPEGEERQAKPNSYKRNKFQNYNKIRIIIVQIKQ